MARYFAFLGQRVEVQYRAGDVYLPATGKLVGDSGKSIFLEEHVCCAGQVKNFRWEIPYHSIVRLSESSAPPTASISTAATEVIDQPEDTEFVPLRPLPERT